MRKLYVIDGKVIMYGQEYELVYPEFNAEETAKRIMEGFNEEMDRLNEEELQEKLEVVEEQPSVKPKKKK